MESSESDQCSSDSVELNVDPEVYDTNPLTDSQRLSKKLGLNIELDYVSSDEDLLECSFVNAGKKHDEDEAYTSRYKSTKLRLSPTHSS